MNHSDEINIVDGWGGDDDLGFDDDEINGLNLNDGTATAAATATTTTNDNNDQDDIEEKLDGQQQYNTQSTYQPFEEFEIAHCGSNDRGNGSNNSKLEKKQVQSQSRSTQQMEGLVSKLSSFVSSEDNKSNADNGDQSDLFLNEDDNDGWDWNDDDDDDDDDDKNDEDIEEGPSSSYLETSNSIISQSNNYPNDGGTADPMITQQQFLPYYQKTQENQFRPQLLIQPQTQHTLLQKQMLTSPHEQQLLNYIQSIYSPSMIQTINYKLQSSTQQQHQHHHPNSNREVALELCRYYHQRPQLTEYTIDIEVPRMEYQIMISDELILVEKDEIQAYFKLNPMDNLVDDMLLRASNQSLLADIFPLVTGSDGDDDENLLVRNDFFATMIATKCRFVLDMRNERSTQGECNLTLSIPWNDAHRYNDDHKNSQQKNQKVPQMNSNNKLNLASIRFMVHFSPEPQAPFIKYQLVSIQPLLDLNNNEDLEKIHYASISLEEMKLLHGDDFDQHANCVGGDGTTTDRIRDNFIQSIASTQTGFKSALKDIDGIVNVSSKLNFLRNVADKALPILPSANEIMAASAIADDINHQQQQQQQQQQQCLEPTPISQHLVHSKNQKEYQPLPPPPPPPSHPKQQQQSKVGRPIIGGLLMSGITQLAEVVTIPSDVFNIDIEDATNSNVNDDGSPLKLYRKDTPKNENKQGDQLQSKLNHEDVVIPRVHKEKQPNVSTMQSHVMMPEKNELIDHLLPKDMNDKIDNDDNDDNNEDGWCEDDDLDLDFNDESEKVTNKTPPSIENVEASIINNKQTCIDEPHQGSKNENNLSTTTNEGQLQDLLKGCTRNESNLLCTSSSSSNKKQDDEGTQERNLTPRQRTLIAKMEEIRKFQLKMNDPVPEGFVYDETTGIIPTRKRFIPRSEIFCLGFC